MSGSGGGGGGSGKVEYPTYMQTMHTAWLTDLDGHIDGALLSNPYTGYTAYDPDAYSALMITAIGTYVTYLNSIDSAVANAADVAAFSTLLQSVIDSDVIPAFEAGMRDINAVQSSAFVIGKALLYARKDDQVADYAAKLNTTTKMQFAGLRKDVMTSYLDTYRISIIAKKEEYDQLMESDILYAKWPLDVYQHGANMLSAISGGVASTASRSTKAATALGGMLTGAAAGAYVGSIVPGIGTAIGAAGGAVVGGLAGYLM